MRKLIPACIITIVLLSACTKVGNSNVATESNAVAKSTSSMLTINEEDGSSTTTRSYIITLGDKLTGTLFDVLAKYSSSEAVFQKDTTMQLGTYDTLEAFMMENYKYVDGSQESTDAEVDRYIEGYYENTNIRILGGNDTDGSYFTITVYNPAEQKVDVEDGIVKSYWLLNPKDITIEHKGIKTGNSYDEYKELLSSYTEVEDPQYSDMEFNKIEDKENITIYVTDNTISGIKVTY